MIAGTRAARAGKVRRLLLAGSVVVAACYAPETPECALACEASTDCAGDQVCTSDHLCAAEGTATCAGRTVGDGGTVDTRPPMVVVTIQISGGGSVDATPGTACSSGTCQFEVPVSAAVTLTAVDHGNNVFDMWTTPACAGQDHVCHFAPAVSTTVGVKFVHD